MASVAVAEGPDPIPHPAGRRSPSEPVSVSEGLGVAAAELAGSNTASRAIQPANSLTKVKWSPDEDARIIVLRGSGMKWEDISKRLPGRSAISCRLHYQNYLQRRSEWDEERKNKLAGLYER